MDTTTAPAARTKRRPPRATEPPKHLDAQMKLVAGRLVRERNASPPALALAFGISSRAAHEIYRRALQGLSDE